MRANLAKDPIENGVAILGPGATRGIGGALASELLAKKLGRKVEVDLENRPISPSGVARGSRRSPASPSKWPPERRWAMSRSSRWTPPPPLSSRSRRSGTSERHLLRDKHVELHQALAR